jgi:hypothetical protein
MNTIGRNHGGVATDIGKKDRVFICMKRERDALPLHSAVERANKLPFIHFAFDTGRARGVCNDRKKNQAAIEPTKTTTGGEELAMKIRSMPSRRVRTGPKLRKWKPVSTGVMASHVDLPDAAE